MKNFIPSTIVLSLLIVAFSQAASRSETSKPSSPIELKQDDAKGALRVLVDGKEALVFRHGPLEDLAHYWPVRSPSGKSMTVQHPTAEEKYPHHRSFWFGDKVKLEGKRAVGFYSAYYSKKKGQEKKGYADRVRHVKFVSQKISGKTARVRSVLVWEMDYTTPVLDETRDMRIVALGGGEYLLDITFTLTAAHGDVAFVSDWVHYAWPYIRMNRTFNVDHGGTITDSKGRVNQKATNGQYADWVDYSNTVDGKTEGLVIYSHPDNRRPHKWLTRNYGCFGPRRADAQSGKPFTLKRGQSIKQRVGVLVHSGDVKTGRVAERYRKYVRGEL